jgi:hypothetical protein
MELKEHLPILGGDLNDIIAAGKEVFETDVPIFHPPCECPDCQESFYTANEQQVDRFSYLGSISGAEANRVIQNYTVQIHKDRQFLLRTRAM